ncbi:hypothetical protein SAMN05421820_10732 [Pedobacter steynii]|uniref:Uncharacterized protein n=1 Tax=Pedobacter steynii TaxID=430522 RepID=A0A1H0AA12_9SPHI|nr:hypothetical protein SAMN05421820_10732 [Pedobacter steynii]
MGKIKLKDSTIVLNRDEMRKVSGGITAATVCQNWLKSNYETCFNCCLTAFVYEIEHCDALC